MIKRKIIIHKLTDMEDTIALIYANKALKEIIIKKQELELGDSRYFLFNTGVKVQVDQNKTCKTIIIY